MVFTVYYIRHASLNFNLNFCVFSDWQYTQYDCRKLSVTLYCNVVGFWIRMNSLSSAWPWCWGSRRGGEAPGRIQDPPQRHGGIPQAPNLTARGAPDVSHLLHYFCLTLTSIAAVQEFNVFQFGGLLSVTCNASLELKRTFPVKFQWCI